MTKKDKYKAQAKYEREKMAHINGKYKKEFVNEFKEALKVLGIKQSHYLRECMQNAINEANKKSQ